MDGVNDMKRVITLTFFACTLYFSFLSAHAPEEYQFLGRHFIASYYDCDHEALVNLKQLSQTMKRAARGSGAHILQSSEYVFEPDGFTMVILLSESHASIHTYPEKNGCFIDLFTCGTKCSAEKFDKILRDYLQPKEVSSQVLARN